MTTHKSKDLNFTETQLRVLLELADDETVRLERELAILAEGAYHWNNAIAREMRMRKRVTEGIAAKVLAAVQHWTTGWAGQEQRRTGAP